MKEYLSISRDIQYGVPAYMFDKLDGSNIRAEWEPKKHFHKFGSRKRLIGTDQNFLTEAIDLVKANFEREISDIFKKQRYEKGVCFFEFWGEHSFAGQHIEEPHKVSLIDVSPHKRGILLPKVYLDLFGNLDIAKLLYMGNINKPIEQQIREDKMEGVTFEGVVCKSDPLKNGYPPFMCKIKTNKWIEKLKDYCKGDESLFQQLL